MTNDERRQIEALYLEMYDRLMAYACCFLENENLAEEAIQETFRTACQKPEALLLSPNPKGWLLNTLKYTISNMKRTQATAARLLVEYTASLDPGLMVSEDTVPLEIIYSDVADSEEFRILHEMAIEGQSHLEMARKRGISVAACKKRVQRAKEYLRKKIT